MRRRIGIRPDGRRFGGALVASLAIVATVATLSAGMLQLHTVAVRRQVLAIDNKRALYTAEAGLAEAMLAVAQGKTGAVGAEDNPASFGDGYFWVEAEEEDGGYVTLTSVGMCGRGRLAISAVLRRDVNPIGLALLSCREGLDVGAGVVIDGYDSSEGTFESQVDGSLAVPTTGSGGRIASDSDVQLAADDTGYQSPPGGTTVVFGDVTPGPGGSVLTDPGARVTGSTAPAFHLMEEPEVRLPDLGEGVESYIIGEREYAVLEGGDHRYARIDVQELGKLVLNGPITLVVDEFRLRPDAELSIDPSNGPVAIYVLDRLAFRQDSILSNPVRQARDVALFIGNLEEEGNTGGPLSIRSCGEFFGMIYSPYEALTIPRTLRVFGSIAAKQVTVEDGARLSYDRALITGGVGVATLPRLLSWRLVGLPDAPLVQRRVDPRILMATLGITPTPAPAAHQEIEIVMNYVDGDGEAQEYTGLLSSFDWSSANRVVSVQWIHGETGALLNPTVHLGNRNTGNAGFDGP